MIVTPIDRWKAKLYTCKVWSNSHLNCKRKHMYKLKFFLKGASLPFLVMFWHQIDLLSSSLACLTRFNNTVYTSDIREFRICAQNYFLIKNDWYHTSIVPFFSCLFRPYLFNSMSHYDIRQWNLFGDFHLHQFFTRIPNLYSDLILEQDWRKQNYFGRFCSNSSVWSHIHGSICEHDGFMSSTLCHLLTLSFTSILSYSDRNSVVPVKSKACVSACVLVISKYR